MKRTVLTKIFSCFQFVQLGLRTSASGHSALSVNKHGSKTPQPQQQQQQQQVLLLQQTPLQPTIAAASVSSAVDQQAAAAAAMAAANGAGPSFVTMRDRPLPATPRIYDPLQEQQIFPSNGGGDINGCNDDTEHLLFNKSSESSPIIVSAHAINNNTISNSTSNSNLSNLANNNSCNGVDKTTSNMVKVPPRPPPKPKKKMPTISAITENANGENAAGGKQFQDECEDGTEV